ncbi:secreted RxLR effector protein 161-like [Benincasa hispida]|uniref:secreted RxLR effector protein 161-like n=1 Tax=Benincasa hispida TaxID=102211 RepID=UPI0019022F57|nr:secreted RxLR effector protein 161-like [Benincasa hispida]
MSDVKPVLSPIFQGSKLSKVGGQPLFEPFIYQSTIGALQYLTHTWSDITYAVNQLIRFLQTPTNVHWQATKRVLRYIRGTKHYGIYFQPSLNLHIFAYSDADWASNLDDRKSVAAYCTFVGNNIVSWSSRKQSVVARSNTEFEYRALIHATSEVLWLQQLLGEMGL